MTRIICILSILIHFQSNSQQRIGADLSTKMDNLMLTVHVQKIVKKRLLYSAGIFIGGNGRVFFDNHSSELYGADPIETPFTNANRPMTDTSGTYSILDYNYSTKSAGVQLGIGYFHEFDVQHGLRFNLTTWFGFAQSNLKGYYRSIETPYELFAEHYSSHFLGGISLEAYHTIRLSNRNTLYYGLKVPYFFSLDKASFNPIFKKDLLYGFEPQISLGFTRMIGHCD